MPIGSGLAAQLGIADEVYTNEVQQISGTPSAPFSLIFDGAQTTVSGLATNAAAAAVQSALEALPNIGVGGVTCGGGALPAAITITFVGPLVAGRNVSAVTVQSGITGLTVATNTPGTGYGDYTVPTRFLEVIGDESIQLDIQNIESKGLRSGNTVLRSDRRYRNKKGAGGSTSFEVPTKGFGLFLRQMMGACAITTPGGGTLSRDHTGTLADLFGRSATVQIGRPDTMGGATNVRPFSYLGGKVVQSTFKNSVDDLLMVEIEWDFMDETTAQALASASFASSFKQLPFTGASLSIAGALTDVTNVELTIPNAMKTDRYFLRNSPLKKQPILNAFREITGKLEAEFTDLSLYNRFVNGDIVQLVALWEGDIIETTLRFGVQITLPAIQFDGETPNLNDADLVPLSMPFKVLNDGTNEPVSIRYRTTDVAL